MKEPWQLVQFRYGLKKRAKFRSLSRALGRLDSEAECLLVTAGDNNGALNHHFRSLGGRWTWGEMEEESIPDMQAFLGEHVVHIGETDWPWPESSFDVVVSVDCLEHLRDEGPFLHSLFRVAKPGARLLITVPEGNTRRLLNRLRYRIGMTPERYGHFRQGYTAEELRDLLRRTGAEPETSGGYSRFFTELIELGINSLYVFVLSRKKAKPGQIAPTTSGDFKQHGAAFRLYKLLFPCMRAVAALDALLPFYGPHAVWVLARKTVPAPTDSSTSAGRKVAGGAGGR